MSSDSRLPLPLAGVARYAATIVLGAGVDLGGAMLLASFTRLPLQAAAAVGFSVAVVVNYLMFEFWAFSGSRSRFSMARLGLTAVSSLIALAVRMGIITMLGMMMGSSPLENLARLGTAMIGSMALNFVVVSRVFRRLSSDEIQAPPAS